MTHTVFIDGAAGTTGLEIRERLAGRAEFELLTLDEDRRKEPSARREALNEAEFAILCLPDDAAREAVALIDPASKVRVIDASSAHRVAPGWTYGFPEIVGYPKVAEATRVSNPGCYPTGFLALMAPLVPNALPAHWPYPVNAVSGYSGGGKALIARFEDDPDIAYRAYALSGGHKHLSEMQHYAGLHHPPLFVPAVVPAHRGMIVEVPLALSAMPVEVTAEMLEALLEDYYGGSTLINVRNPEDELLIRRSAKATDRLDIYVYDDASTGQARLVAVLDNLGKGASGSAVQCLNLMAGLPETAGLRL